MFENIIRIFGELKWLAEQLLLLTIFIINHNQVIIIFLSINWFQLLHCENILFSNLVKWISSGFGLLVEQNKILKDSV